jgi:hypothetical protein
MRGTPSLSREPQVFAVLSLLFAVAAAAAPGAAAAPAAAAPAARCLAENTVKAWVVALDQRLVLNRFGSDMPGGMIFALARDVFPKDPPPPEYSEQYSCRFAKPVDPSGTASCTAGNVQLRPTATALPGKRPRPLVLRANEGDCLDIYFTNLLGQSARKNQPTTRKAGVHVQGLNWVRGSQDDGSNVGTNGSSLAAPGESKRYELYAEHEGSYLLYSTADDWNPLPDMGGGDGGTLAEGLFGAVNVQPSHRQRQWSSDPYRSHVSDQDWQSEFYRSQVTEQDLCLASTDKVLVNPLHCARRAPGVLPTLNYQALYPKGHPREYVPILNMMCSQALTKAAIDNHRCVDGELVHGDLTAIITGPSAPDPRLPKAPPQPRQFPSDWHQQPPSLRPNYAYPVRFQPFREYTIIYHESFQVTQAFEAQINGVPGINNGNPTLPSLQAAQDNFGINYGMAGLSNEVLANRVGVGPLDQCVDCKYEEFFLSSWAMGDPSMNVDVPASACVDAYGHAKPGCKATKAYYPDDPSNVYHSYMSDHLRFRILHAGPDLHHLHHQHAQQWLGTPNSPDGDYLDSQTIGPGSAFTLEMVYNGSGNVNQTVGDSIFHCHFYPHFASGMWSLWRVHDVFEPGTILDDTGQPLTGPNPVTHQVEYPRALPDGEIEKGTPTVALVPLPTLPMAPMPAEVRLEGVCKDKPATNCLDDQACGGAAGSCVHMGSRYCVLQDGTAGGPQTCLSEFQTTSKSWDQVQKSHFAGYPFFVPGIGGSRPPHPPLDFAYACSVSGKICDPTAAEGLHHPERADYQAPIFTDSCGPGEGICEPMDGGLPRAVTAQGPRQGSSSAWQAPDPAVNYDFSKEIEKAQAIEVPEVGTQLEKVAMAVHAQRFHDTQLPDGRKTGICSDNKAPCSTTDLAQCDDPAKATCLAQGRINFVLNGLGPAPGAPYADPCIRFDRRGGRPNNMLTRSYLAADMQLDAIFNREGWHFPQQRIISLWGDVKDFLDRKKPPEPLFLRANSYDCMTYVLANLVPNVYEQDDFQVRTPTDVIGQHIHLVKFDVTSSDGAENGWNYEDGTYGPNEVTERINAINEVGGLYEAPGEKEPGGPCPGGKSDQRCLKAKYIKFFGPGPGAKPYEGAESGGAWVGSQATVQRWYDDPLFNNSGRCSTDLTQPCTLGQEEAGIYCPGKGTCQADAGWCSNDPAQPCTQSDLHLCFLDKAGPHPLAAKQPQYVSCEPSHDRTIRTVFTHDHFGPSTHQQGGLYAGVIAEPKGSVWRENESGAIMGGYDAATNQNYSVRTSTQHGVTVKDGGPTSWQAVIETPRPGDSFREFLLEVQDSTLLYQPFTVRRADPFAYSRPKPCDADANSKEPCGFCSFTGFCSNNGKLCQIANDGSNPVLTQCGSATAQCNFGENSANRAQPYLVACTPADMSACYDHLFKDGQPEACNFIPGIPQANWKAGGNFPGNPIDLSKGGIEAITFKSATNSFSYNYREEPLYPRIDSPGAPTSGSGLQAGGVPMAGSRGDLAFVYSSLRFCSDHPRLVCTQDADCGAGDTCGNRPNPRGMRCKHDLTVVCGADSDCPPGTAGSCQEAGFCSDNYELCAKDNKTLCGAPGATCLTSETSTPYPPLTAGVEATDPFTPLLRGYAGDDVQVRVLIGAHINPHNFTIHGLNWLNQPSYVDSGWRNSQVMGISEHYNLLLKLLPLFNPPPAGEAAASPWKPWLDAVYQPGAAAIEQASGNWGLIRAYGEPRPDLFPLPQNDVRPGHRFDQVAVCPPDAPRRDYTVVALTAQQALGGPLVYNEAMGLSDPGAMIFFNAADLDCSKAGDWSTCRYKGKHADPLVLRAAAGDCIHVKLYNGLPSPETAFCSSASAFTAQNCTYGSGCQSSNGPGTCLLYGWCSNAPATACTPNNLAEVCPAVLCKNGYCTNNPSQACTQPNTCPQLTCNALIGHGVSSAQINALLGGSQDYLSNISLEVGLRPQLVTYDPRFSDGTNAGFNPPQTAAPGGSVTYTWYAGHVDPGVVGKDNQLQPAYIPIEFGAANLLPPDPINHALHALFGGLVIEPKGATWDLSSGPPYGVQANVHYTDAYNHPRNFQEFVVFTPDDTNLPFNLVNYSTEVLNTATTPPRFCGCSAEAAGDVSCVLNTTAPLFCKSASGSCAACSFNPATPTFTATVGEEVRFRLLHPGGTNTNEVFELAGHTYLQTPYETPPEYCDPAPTTQTNLFASQMMGKYNLCGPAGFWPEEKPRSGAEKWSASLSEWKASHGLDRWSASLSEWKASRPGHGPSNHYDVLIEQAGGPFAACGDYLYRSYPADHFNLGVWGIFHVEGKGASHLEGCSPSSGGAAGSR